MIIHIFIQTGEACLIRPRCDGLPNLLWRREMDIEVWNVSDDFEVSKYQLEKGKNAEIIISTKNLKKDHIRINVMPNEDFIGILGDGLKVFYDELDDE